MGGYCKAEYIGPYSFFNYETHGVGLTAMAVPGHLVIIGDDGEYQDGTVNYVSRFIKVKLLRLPTNLTSWKRKRRRGKSIL